MIKKGVLKGLLSLCPLFSFNKPTAAIGFSPLGFNIEIKQKSRPNSKFMLAFKIFVKYNVSNK